ncbi:MAG TPA: TetR/AcrR family transcriptional regulator [Baekduia sp.]|nr:TetR/AcrR family transcriptional regulator [Baekduia sp.]
MAGDARQRLLEAAIDHVAGHGLTDLSLRSLAAELGTSHRMLIHHFGSKEGLWVAIVQEVERRQLAAVDELLPDPEASLADAMRAWWRHISDPSLWPNERLFFEVYGQALQDRPHTSGLLDGIVDRWLEPVAERGMAMGLPRETAYASARLGIAVTRGLLLDLLATGDRDGVDAAMEHWIELNVAGRERIVPPTAG